MFKKSSLMFKLCSRRLLSVKPSASFDWTNQEKVLMEPFEYLRNVPCIHYMMIGPAFNHWLQIPENKLNDIQEVVRTWCTWNLMIDDIQDDSSFRYGVPAVHRIFGLALTINAANKALLQLPKQLENLGHPLGAEVFTKRILENFHGQGIDLYWRDNHICPTEEAHIEMAKKKTGSGFEGVVELVQLFSTNKADYSGLALNMGVYYEILDDYYNLFQPKALSKFCIEKQENHFARSDIADGKMTLAIIHALQFPDVAAELADILKQRTSDSKLQNRAISLLKKHGSDNYVRDKLRKMDNDIRTQIVRLGGNEKLTALMDDLAP